MDAESAAQRAARPVARAMSSDAPVRAPIRPRPCVRGREPRGTPPATRERCPRRPSLVVPRSSPRGGAFSTGFCATCTWAIGLRFPTGSPGGEVCPSRTRLSAIAADRGGSEPKGDEDEGAHHSSLCCRREPVPELLPQPAELVRAVGDECGEWRPSRRGRERGTPRGRRPAPPSSTPEHAPRTADAARIGRTRRTEARVARVEPEDRLGNSRSLGGGVGPVLDADGLGRAADATSGRRRRRHKRRSIAVRPRSSVGMPSPAARGPAAPRGTRLPTASDQRGVTATDVPSFRCTPRTLPSVTSIRSR